MRHRVNTLKLNRSSAHRKAMLANLVSSLILEEKIETTLAKAKAAARMADKMVTLAKKDTLAARRQAVSTLRRKDVVKKLFDELGPRFATRPGGYTRVLKLASFRRGDGSRTAVVLFSEDTEAVAPTKGKAKAAAKPKAKVAKPKAEKTEPAQQKAPKAATTKPKAAKAKTPKAKSQAPAAKSEDKEASDK